VLLRSVVVFSFFVVAIPLFHRVQVIDRVVALPLHQPCIPPSLK
jgi:hypothetical protein